MPNRSIDDNAARGPAGLRKSRTKIERRLTVEKMVCTKSINVEMIFKNENFLQKTKKSFEISIVEMSNVPEMKKPPEISIVEMPNVPK